MKKWLWLFVFFNGALLAFDEEYAATSIKAGYLILKPSVTDLDFAKNSAKLEKIEPGFRSGLQLNVCKSKVLGDFGLSLEYMYWKSEKERSLSGNLVPTLIPLGESGFNAEEAEGKWKMRFQTLDVLLNYRACKGSMVHFTPYLGAEMLILNQMIMSKFTDFQHSLRSHWQSDYFGVGLVIGTRLFWHFSGCLTFFTDASARIIRGTADMDDHFEIPDQNFKLRYDDCFFVPGYKLVLGLSFAHNFCGKEFSLDTGYTFMSFNRIPNPRRYFAEGGALGISTSPSTAILGLHGAFVNIKASF